MSEREVYHVPEAETMHRARVYLKKTEWLKDTDIESIDEWRQSVSKQLIDVSSLLKDVDRFYDLSVLKEVRFKQYIPETETIMLSRQSIMLWRLPGMLCKAGECYIGMDDCLYVTELDRTVPRQNPVPFQKPFFDLDDKDVVFLEDSLNRVIEAYGENDDGTRFYSLFKEK